MIDSITGNRRVRNGVYIVFGLLTVAVVALSFVQLYLIYSAPDVPGYGSIRATEQGYPPEDRRGAFLVLNEHNNPAFVGNLVELLATTEPGVVSPEEGAHVRSPELKSILIQSAALNEPDQYRVYRIGVSEPDIFDRERQPGGRVMLITPKDGKWPEGAYSVDIPAEGMYGGRTYFQFYVDPE
ncbi:MAG TPA: hypothetical protein VFR15_20155 [Chloroflexia bacterium]|nr:hypothetical protein [Chloroflexia bacterium]